MSILRSFIWHRETVDSNAAIRRLISLRLAMLMIVCVSLLTWSLTIEPYPNWPLVVLIVTAVGIWSVSVLCVPSIQALRYADLREILIDIAWVFVIVFVSGRTTNPFIYYYLVLTAIAATLLTSRQAWLICGLSVVLYSTMLILDVKAHFAHFSTDYKVHLVGMWVNYVGSSIVICLFATKLILALREQQRKLTSIRENNLENEQLIALATVSASTVHNLATPLSTLTLLTDEVSRTEGLDSGLQKDLGLMREQIERCRTTMRELSSLAEESGRSATVSVNSVLHDLKEHYALHFPESKLNFEYSGSHRPLQDTLIECSQLFEYALINLINNALESSQSAPSSVKIVVSCTQKMLVLAIQNECDDTLETLAERWGKLSDSDKDAGLGIGSLLANSTIERQGGTVELEVTSSPPASGGRSFAVVTVTFPLYKPDHPTNTRLAE